MKARKMTTNENHVTPHAVRLIPMLKTRASDAIANDNARRLDYWDERMSQAEIEFYIQQEDEIAEEEYYRNMIEDENDGD